MNLKNNEFFDENSYSLPRLANGYKGEEIPTLMIPVVKHVTPPSSTSMTRSGKVSNFPTSVHQKSTDRLSTGSGGGSDDNASVVSELTERRDSDVGRRGSADGGGGGNKKNTTRKMTRKSIFDTTQLAINAGNIAGRNMLSGDMCVFIKEESVDGGIAEQLKEASISDPYVLLGWQVSVSFFCVCVFFP